MNKTNPVPSSALLRGLLCGALLALSAGAALSGCGGSAMVVVRPEALVPGAAQVRLVKQEDDLFEFKVYNQSPDPMVVNRDAVMLQSAAGIRSRVPGGISSIYNIPPGGVHDVNVKYRLEGLQPGEQVYVQFQGAITINGQPVAIEPIVFAVR